MKTKKVLNIKPQEVCEGGEHYVRYKGCDGRMHELPTHTVTHNERVKEMFITSIDTLHSVIMSAELTNPEARAVFQASFPNAIEVKDIQVAGCFLRDDSQQSELRFDAPLIGVPQKRFPHYYAIDSQGTIRFISDGEPVDQSSLSLAEDHEAKPELVAFFQRTLDSIAGEITPKLWAFFVAHVTRMDFSFSFTMVEKHLCVIDKNKQTYDAGVLTPVSACASSTRTNRPMTRAFSPPSRPLKSDRHAKHRSNHCPLLRNAGRAARYRTADPPVASAAQVRGHRLPLRGLPRRDGPQGPTPRESRCPLQGPQCPFHRHLLCRRA